MDLRKHKPWHILLCNVVILVFILLLTEFIFVILRERVLIFEYISAFQEVVNPEIPKISFREHLTILKKIVYEQYIVDRTAPFFYKHEFRLPYTGSDYNGDDIVLAGCSITRGDAIKSEDTFGAVLSEIYPKYRVYNIGVSGGSARETLYILRNYDEYKNWGILPGNPKNTKYFIYTFFDEHKLRIYHNMHRRGPAFNIKKDKNGHKFLEYNNNPGFLAYTFTYRYFAHNYCFRSKKYLNNLLTLYMQELKKEVDSIFPNAQFVFFVYWGDEEAFDMAALEKMGFKILILKNMTDIPYWDDKYKTWDKCHPNRNAWEAFVPLLGKELDF